MGGSILVIDSGSTTSQDFYQLLKRLPYTADIYDAFDRLPPDLDFRRYRAVLIDLDDKTPSKATLAAWRKSNKNLKILGMSSRSFHPDLSEVIGQELFACLTKPVDEDELLFLLRSAREFFGDETSAT